MKKYFSILYMLIQVSAFAQVKLEKLWQTDSTLKVPESVRYDAKNNVLYVANIEGKEPWGADGKGSIGKLGVDGKIINAEWVTGLNAPKGMALVGNNLYVADLTELVVIDIVQGAITKKIKIDSALGLNDVSADGKNIYITDSKAKKLFVINKKDEVSTLLTGLKGPNGILKTKKQFFILDAGTVYAIGKKNELKKIVDGLEGGTDGIEQVGKNQFIVSCWSGVVYNVNTAEKTKTVLLDTRNEKINSADIGINKKKNIIYVPTFWRNAVVAYKIVR